MNRRQFSRAVAGVICVAAHAETNLWGGPVVDCHHHLRRNAEDNIAHLDGCGVSNAMVLARESAGEQIQTIEQKYPGRVVGWFASTDISKPDAEALLTKARMALSAWGRLSFMSRRTDRSCGGCTRSLPI